MSTRIDTDVYVTGNLNSQTLTIPAGTILNAAVNTAADIAATKLEHRHKLVYAQESGTNAADESRVLYVCYGATATVIAFEAGNVVAATGNATCTVDLKKNGSSILSAAISLDSTNAARVVEAGTLSNTALVDGDVLEITIDGTIGTGTLAKGIFASLIVDEKPN